MTLASLKDTAHAAHAAGIGLGAFNVVQLETAEALAAAAESTELPVVLQISQNAVKFHHGKLSPLGKAVLTIASESRAQIIVHLDHANDLSLIEQAVALGFSSVMYDGSHLDYASNVATTQRVVQMCHAAGLTVEAELGEIGGKDGVHAPRVRTKPQEAQRFIEETGVDLLAVAVGSSHAMTERSATLDPTLIRTLKAALDVPLVLHGSSGVSDEGMVEAIEAGMTKINVSTHLNGVFTAGVRDLLASHPQIVDPRKYFGPAHQLVQKEAERLLRLWAKG